MAYTKTEWVDQEGQVKYTETTEGSYKIFTPNFDDVTETGTPVNAIHMNNIENGIEYCDTNMVVRKSTSQATGSASTPVYIKADGTVETCNAIPDNTVIDGQWVFSTQLLSSATSIGVYTVDVSAYLPNDAYTYEIKVCYMGFRQSGDANSLVSICPTSNVIEAVTTDIGTVACYGVCNFDGNHAEAGNIECSVIVDGNRTFYLGIKLANLHYSRLAMVAYRRLGTNQ